MLRIVKVLTFRQNDFSINYITVSYIIKPLNKFYLELINLYYYIYPVITPLNKINC